MYKIIRANRIIDVIEYADFIRFLPSGIVIRTSKELAQGVIGSNGTAYSFDTTNLKPITDKAEFNRLKDLLNSAQAVYDDVAVITDTRASKIEKLSAVCSSKITDGFDIRLSDGVRYNFRLTAEDQLNLLNIENQMTAGASTFLYHATGHPCKMFSYEDMTSIIKAFRAHVLYHTTYFNTAKQYILTLEDIEKIDRFTYGMDVSSLTDDTLVKRILKNRGNL
jgi:hypothetical protein